MYCMYIIYIQTQASNIILKEKENMFIFICLSSAASSVVVSEELVVTCVVVVQGLVVR